MIFNIYTKSKLDTLSDYSIVTNRLFWLRIVSILICSFVLSFGQSLNAQSCHTSEVIAKFDFNGKESNCAGSNQSFYAGNDAFKAGQFTHCPSESLGCGEILLGSRGHSNTGWFSNALCLLNFYNIDKATTRKYGGASDYDPSSPTFDPESSANFYVDYTIPIGVNSCIDGFDVTIMQKNFNGSTLPFQSQGIAIYRNGVLILEDIYTLTTANINATPASFDFSGSQFCSDGSQEITFRVVFGLVEQLGNVPTKSSIMGYDDVCLRGTCNTGTSGITEPILATCDGLNTVLDNGQIQLSLFQSTDKFDYSIGNSYSGSADYASANAIPSDGIIASDLPNPSNFQDYTIRVFNLDGCHSDFIVRLPQAFCPLPCTEPTGEIILVTPATCAGNTANDNASIAVSGVIGADRVGISLGSSYTGPDYSVADNLSAGAFTFSNLPNPVSNQFYTVRIFNAQPTCFIDRVVEIFETSCDGSACAYAEIVGPFGDADSTPSNGMNAEDDQAKVTSIDAGAFVDLELSKTVSQSTGTTSDIYTYTITVSNSGTMDATGVQITENFPVIMGIEPLGGTPATPGSGGDELFLMSESVSLGTFGVLSGWQIETLSAGQSATLTLNVRAAVPGTYMNCAYVTNVFPDNDPDSSDENTDTANEDDDDCAEIIVTGPALPIVTKEFAAEQGNAMGPIKLTIKLNNPNTLPITLTADLIDNLPTAPGTMTVATIPNLTTNLTGITVNANDQNITIPNGTILPSGLSQVTVDVVVSGEGEYCNQIPVGALQTTAGANFAVAEACTQLYNDIMTPPFVETSKVDISSANEEVKYTLSIETYCGVDATLTQDFTLVFPEGVTLTSGANTGTLPVESYSAGDDNFTIAQGTVLPAGVSTVVLPVTSSSAGCFPTLVPMNELNTTCGSNENIAESRAFLACSITVDSLIMENCDPDMDTYDLNVFVTYSTLSGTDLTINGTTFTTDGSGMEAFTLSGLTADGVTLSVIVEDAGDNTCNDMSDFDTPDECPIPCELSFTANASPCDGTNNLYDLTILASYTGAPAGDISFMINGSSYTFTPTGTSPEDFVITGLNSDGALAVVVTGQFVGQSTCSGMTSYDAPATCFIPQVGIPCVDGSMGGTVFVDTDANGQNDDSNPAIDLSGMIIQIFGCSTDGSSVLIETVITDENGEYSFTNPSIVDGGEYRIEFSNLPDGYTSSIAGADNGTDIQSASTINCGVDYGIIDPLKYCQNNPLVVTPCYINGLQNSGRDVLVGINYDRTGTVQHMATDNQIGPTWGVAYQKKTKTIFTSAILKRHVAFGPDGMDAIYMMDYSSPGSNGSGSVVGVINLFDDFGISVGTDPRNGGNSDIGAPENPSRDAGVYEAIATVGLGDIDVSNDGNTLYVMNLAAPEVVVLDITDLSNVSLIAQYPIANPGCGTFRPWAVKLHNDELYVGGVCQNASSAYILKYNPTTSQFDSVTDFSLAYERGCATMGANCRSANWKPWVTSASNHGLVYAQPVLSDIEFDSDDSLILGFFDRYGHQTGFPNYSGSPSDNTLYWFFSAGDILRVCNTSAGYAIEGSAGCGYNYSPVGPPAGQGGPLSEYYADAWTDNINSGHDETPLGGLAILQGTNEVVSSVYDPISFNTGGLTWFNNLNGSQAADYQLYAAGDPGTFGKTNGLGDVELLCDLAPSQIGNYAWIDANGDGVQDPCEEPLPGLTVKLYTKPATGNAQLVATTTTSATGEYYFTNNTTAGETWSSGFTTVEAGDYYIVFCADSYDPLNGFLTLGSDQLLMTTANSGMGSNVDLNDNDVEQVTVPGVGDVPAICISVTETDFSFDAGFMLECGIVLDTIRFESTSAETKAIIDLSWINGPTVGDFEYRFDNTGVWQSLTRTNLIASGAEKLEVVLPLVNFNIINIRFEDDPGCFIDIMTIFNIIGPAGYFYCERTGEILKGGNVDVIAPEGGQWSYVSDADGNPKDGSSGFYEWVSVGSPIVPGLYTMDVTPPPGTDISMTTFPGNPSFGDGDTLLDLTLGSPDYPSSLDTVQIGSGVNADSTFLLDYASTSNPFFYDLFLPAQNIYVTNNNIPIKNCYCDLALVNKLDEEPTGISVGDTIKYDIIVENQGDVDATNIEIKYNIPNGFEYLSLNDGISPSWTKDTDCASTLITDVIPGGGIDTVCIYLAVANVPTEDVTTESWTTIAEISSFEDPADPGEDKEDFDSTPDDDPTNDSGGNPDDDTDDETGGDGSGDPEDPTEDSDPELDEDDHDPAKIEVCDAAAIIYLDETGPIKYQDTVSFKVVVFNQGNGPITNVEINAHLGEGVKFVYDSSNDLEGWTISNGMLSMTSAELLLSGETDTICLTSQIVSTSEFNEDDHLVEIEIVQFEDPEDLGTPKEDIDSTPDSDPDNDPGGNPDDETDNETDGEGTGDPEDPTEDSDPTMDEDDHDPVLVPIFDLAIQKLLLDDRPYQPNELVTFDFNVINQGNVAADNYKLIDYLPQGFTFSPTGNAGWSTVGDDLEYTSSAGIAPGDTAKLQLQLTVIVPAVPTGVQDWWNYVEISEADDNADASDPDPIDADSYPDTVEDNDNNGSLEPEDPEDDVVSENGDLGEDEDDHDVEKVLVGYDLALRKTVSPAGPYSYGDTLTYTLAVFNQGGLVATDISLADKLPCGLRFESSINDSDWVINGDVVNTVLNGPSNSGDVITKDLKLIVQRCADPGYDNYYNEAEITSFKDENGDEPLTGDIDSTPDDDFTNDGTPNDNEIQDPNDEDDHDFEDIEICDVALINTIADLHTDLNVGDTIKYEVIVENQGNHDVNSISIDYDIPNGLTFLPVNSTLTPMWSSGFLDDADVVTENILVPGDRDTICLYLMLENVPTDEVTEDSWTTIAEITEYTNEVDEVKTTDADSTPDDDPTNDSGGNPSDDTDNELDGDGSGDPENPTEDMDPELDEDDHDPTMIEICDAATIIYHDVPDEINYYDTLKFNVVVYNQGNGEITNINLIDHLPEGLAFIETASNTAEGWEESLVTADAVELLYEELLGVGESDTLCLELELLPINDGSDEEAWLQEVEITSFEDPENPGDPKEDIDSTPDEDPSNDSGGNPDDTTDNVTDGEGTGDPEDEMEDMDPTEDEDDHDPVDVKVLDLALIMQIDSMPPVLPVLPGDEVKFIVVVYNQGNTTVSNIELTNYLMDENVALSDNTANDEWTVIDSETNVYTLSTRLEPGQVDTVCVYLEVVNGAMSDIITYSEISGSTETDNGDCYDIDSTPNDVLEDDEGGVPLTSTDDHIQDDGEDGNEDGIADEDDHDPANLNAQDLSLIVWSTQKDPVKAGDDVKFKIRVVNQGNIVNKDIEIVNYIPSGFNLSDNDNNDWIEIEENIFKKLLSDTLMMGDTAEACIVLEVLPGSAAEDFINYAEILTSKDINGDSLDDRDIDSTPDMDIANDEGGEHQDPVDCDTEPTIIEDDNYEGGAGRNGEDEDDHDPAWVHVFDLATIIYTDHTQPIIPGDEVKFIVDIFNQGNVSAGSLNLHVYLPSGFKLSENDVDGWEEENGLATISINTPIESFKDASLCMLLEVLPDFMLDDLIPIVEIGSVQDTLGYDMTNFDLDSNPDQEEDNDDGGVVFSGDDNFVDGDGNMGEDEDDHDPVVPPVMDLAVRIINTEGLISKVPGDIVKFKITVFNQGSMTPKTFTLQDYIPEGLSFAAVADNDDWDATDPTNPTYLYDKVLSPMEEDSVCIWLEVLDVAHPLNVINMVEISYVEDELGNDVSLRDIDSEADAINDDKGNDPYSDEDDKIAENGRSGFDEDDHDQAFVMMCQEMVCTGFLNISLDNSCSVELTATMLMEGILMPTEFYEFIITNSETGEVHLGNDFDFEDIGNTYEVSIINPFCGNSCWSTITVEDKYKPSIDCGMPVTLPCNTSEEDYPDPIVTDNCGGAELVLVNQTVTPAECESYLRVVERTFIAVDEQGNESDPCTQTIIIDRVNTSGILFPENYSSDVCTASTDPLSTGVPMFEGAPIYPEVPVTLCNVFVSFEDTPLGSGDCNLSFMRVWTVGEWYCGTTEGLMTWVQMIEVNDLTPPTISCPADMTVTTNGGNGVCESSVTLPSAIVNDDCNNPVDVVINGGSEVLFGNGGEMMLPVGTTTLTYVAYDGCYNSSSCNIDVTVVDQTQPTIVCKLNTVVSLQSTGLAEVFAEVFDNGSYDDCEIELFEAARMDDICNVSGTDFGPTVTFCCEDVGNEVMVRLRATDTSGNYNVCMVVVEVQDKEPSTLTCPADETVACGTPYDITNLSIQFGTVTVDDNCANQTVTETVEEDVDQCGLGTVTRTFTMPDGVGGTTSCTQIITFANSDPFDGDDPNDLIWPLDLTIDGMCSLDDVHPDNLSAPFNYPIVTEDACDLVGVNYDDQIFSFVQGEDACFKVLRRWRVVDWCQNVNGVYDTWEYEQIIKVTNDVSPTVVSGCEDQLIETLDCDAAFVSLQITGSDDCTSPEGLSYNYSIENLGDGNIAATGSTNDASGMFDLGTYEISWIILDGCGNEETCSSTFEIVSNKAPVAYCIQGLSTELIMMDTDGDGMADTEMVELWASDFDAGSFHSCGYAVTVSFSADPTDTNITFDCSQLGQQGVQIWVTDENGNQSFCNTFVIIEDNDNSCPEMITVDIQGRIFTEDNENVEAADVELLGSQLAEETSEQGNYGFMDMPLGGSYFVDPVKTEEVDNGVSTLDLVLIQKHLLELLELDSPYKLIAADINHDGKISAIDLIQLRKLILGIYDEFPNNDSWRFVDALYEFPIPTDPWVEVFPEDYEIPALNTNMWVNFIGVKVGDVNGSAEANFESIVTEKRSSNPIALKYFDQLIGKDERVEVSIRSDNFKDIAGMQFTILHEGLILESVDGKSLKIGDGQIGKLEKGITSFSWNEINGDAVSVKHDDLFTIYFTATKKLRLSDVFTLDSSHTSIEAYQVVKTGDSESYEVIDVIISSEDVVEMDEELDFVLHQNEPNPWSQLTTINVYSEINGMANLSVKDAMGRTILSRDVNLIEGSNDIILSKSDIQSSGMYFYTLTMDEQQISKQMIRVD